MKRLIILFAVIFFLINVRIVRAQGMMGYQGSPSSNINSSDIQTQQQEENEGKNLLTQLQNKQITCQDLTNDNFEKIGEYFMGQAIGNTSRHIVMNNMMKSMIGDSGEEQMHIAMGKRNSGCDTSFIPMMGSGFGNMMGGWGGFGILGWITMLAFWLLLILGVVALIRYLGGFGKSSDKDKLPLDILKRRYARGEIGKKEFEEMKKDLR